MKIKSIYVQYFTGMFDFHCKLINPAKENELSMNINNSVTDDTDIIANAFNTFFVNKIADLKANIDPNLKKDPLEKLKQNLKKSKASFKLKTIKIKDLKQTIKKLK